MSKGHIASITSLVVSSQNSTFATSSADGSIKIWDIDSMKEKFGFKGHQQAITTLAISPNGRILASGSEDKSLRFWNMKKEQEIALMLPPYKSGISSVAFNHDGQLIAVGTKDGRVEIYAVELDE
jgi:WD40 repeat protein